jgi:hypothetical protein
MNRSASVDLPWSMCAMIEKLRTFCMKENERAPRGALDGRREARDRALLRKVEF